MSFSKVISQPRMFFEKLKGTVSFKQLKSLANTQSRGKLNKQVDMVNSDVQLINLTSTSVSDLPEKKFTIHPKPVELKRIFGIFNFPHEVECVLSEAMLPRFQIHFLSPKLTGDTARANFVLFREGSIYPSVTNQLTELNLMEDGDSSLL